MRVIAILATYNEERFIGGSIEHMARQGVDVYLIDNGSTDRTLEIAEGYRGRGLIGMETFPRHGTYTWRPILRRKEQLAATLDADWLMHIDADEIHLPPDRSQTIGDTFAEADARGYNAVEADEFTFIPTRESPDHDHARFQETMRWYYAFKSSFPHLSRGWKQRDSPVELEWSGGHQVRFPDLRLYPVPFRMRHYQFLSVAHAIRKYVVRGYDPAEVEAGWHSWRARLRPETIDLPSSRDLRPYLDDDRLDPSNPRTTHYLDELLRAADRSGAAAEKS